MGNEQVIIRISSDGAIQAETRGIKGSRCLEAIGLLEDLLEARTISSSFTSEYEELLAGTQYMTEVDDELRQR